LDSISRGEAVSLAYLKRFYFGNGHAGLKELVTTGEQTIDPRLVCGIPLGKLADDRLVEVRIGRYGAFLSDGTRRTSLPEELPPDELTLVKAQEMLNQADKQAEGLGLHPETGERVYLKNGRFGPYIQLGEGGDDKKPKMVSLLKNTKLDDVNLEYALKLLALPKNLGAHSELKQDVFVYNGRFGPYIKCGDDTRSIPLDRISPLEMTLPDAEELLKEPKTRGKSRKPEPLKDLGKHPASGATINLFNGRYGPYVTDGVTNASLPRGTSLETLTLDDAVRLIKERAEKVAENPPPPKKGKRGAKAPKSATGAKKGKKKKAAAEDDATAE
ncbi:MAG: DNA topoisomerase I, partial [Deltaproteobacteria bacterium]|nr:DNA topoisomerase I [Deltaproteobacteria bacterium]